MQFKIQPCSLGDLEILINISRTTFIDAFEKYNNPKDFKEYLTKAFDSENIKKQLLDPNSTFYFVFNEHVLTGYFKLNQNDSQTDRTLANAMELERIYVSKEFQGQQIGKYILREAIKIARQEVHEFLWLGVWEVNTAAVRFYEKHGFQKFDTHPYYIGNDKQTDWLMRYDLGYHKPF